MPLTPFNPGIKEIFTVAPEAVYSPTVLFPELATYKLPLESNARPVGVLNPVIKDALTVVPPGVCST